MRHRWCRPFRAFPLPHLNPGRCPGLACIGPLAHMRPPCVKCMTGSRRCCASPEMKSLRHLSLVGGALLTAFIGGGCSVSGDSQPAHPSWPKPVAVRNVNQFDGVYMNRSLDYRTGKPKADGAQLFEMLTSRTEPRGSRLEIRSTVGEVLRMRLLDGSRRQIAVAQLRRGVDYTLSDQAMILHRQSLGWEGGTTNIGAFLRHSGFRLHLSAAGGLLGNDTERGIALGAYVIPMADSYNYWRFWPKLSP